MAVATIKFSEFVDGGILSTSDVVVGLKSSVNSFFSADNILTNWLVVSSNTVMSANTGYIVNSASPITLTLPLVSAPGDQLAISSLGVGGWIIAQNAGQSITITNTTTVGVTGSLSSTGPTDSVRLVCSVANLAWTTSGGPQGSLLLD